MLRLISSYRHLIPRPIWNLGKKVYWLYLKKKYLKKGRPYIPGETSKAKPRREEEGFFNKFCNGKGLDIGYGGDPVLQNVDVWDFEHGDAQILNGVNDEQYDFVYSSHTLEHLDDPATAIKNWWRVLKKGGYLILYIPHRDLYEKKLTLPSRFNTNHKHFFLVDKDEAPDTIGVCTMIEKNLDSCEIIYIKACSFGYTITDLMEHSNGEYSIEAVIRKRV